MAKENRNQTFVYLYALLIIMVIDDHCSSIMAFGTGVFPYNSFYMPLFVFCSGYFFHKTTLIKDLVKKVKRLFVPYLIWNLAVLIITSVIDKVLGVHWMEPLTPMSLYQILLIGPTTSINEVSWFVIMLFWVSVFYIMIKHILPSNKVSDIITTVVITSLGVFSIWLCVHYYMEFVYDKLWLFRAMFYLVFYDWGHMFKKYLEKHLIKLNTLLVCGICILINLIVITAGFDINYYSTEWMNRFRFVALTFVTSLTGIVFYYELMRVISAKLGSVRLIDFIGRNTFTIMETQMFFINVPSIFIYIQIINGSKRFGGFPIEEFIQGTWSRYQPILILNFFCGLTGSLAVAFMLEKIKQVLKSKRTALLRSTN